MRLAIAVYGAPASSRASYSALRFARAALAAGHTIHRVFFYHDGVSTANALAVMPQGEIDVGAAWSELARQHHFELGVCIAAALRRGVLDAAESQRYERMAHNVREPFEILGLGQLVEAAIECDRLVTFAP